MAARIARADVSSAADPGSPAGLLVRLRGLRPSLSPAEDRVAACVLADPRAAAALTISLVPLLILVILLHRLLDRFNLAGDGSAGAVGGSSVS